jgi:glycine betaine/proline transport system substrate-binding protein
MSTHHDLPPDIDLTPGSYQNGAPNPVGEPPPVSMVTGPLPSADDARRRNLRLGFEAVLIALCGYLIGVAGLPPLFGPPGSDSGSQTVASSSVDGDGVAAANGTEASAGAPSNLLPGAGVNATIGRATWSTGYFQAALFKALLEELGYEVSEPSLNELGPSEMYRIMAEGSVQFWTNSWLPNHQAFLEEELGDGSTISSHIASVGSLMPASGLEGIVVSKAVAEQFQITSLQQINDDPALVELFDSNGNGTADIAGCPGDWGCHQILNELIAFNNWGNLEQVADDYDAMIEQSIGRIDSGAAALQYTWSPSGYLTRLRPGDNVLWLSIGGQDKMLDGSITPEFDFDELEPAALGPACTGDPCYLGWPAADITVTARNAFLEENPSARVLFEQVRLKVLDVALANVKYDTGETAEEDLARHAQDWIAENRPLVDEWLAAARAAE